MANVSVRSLRLYSIAAFWVCRSANLSLCWLLKVEEEEARTNASAYMSAEKHWAKAILFQTCEEGTDVSLDQELLPLNRSKNMAAVFQKQNLTEYYNLRKWLGSITIVCCNLHCTLFSSQWRADYNVFLKLVTNIWMTLLHLESASFFLNWNWHV